METTRSYDLAAMIAGAQQTPNQSGKSNTPRYLGGPESITIIGTATILNNAGPHYHAGGGGLGSGDIVCGYWQAS